MVELDFFVQLHVRSLLRGLIGVHCSYLGMLRCCTLYSKLQQWKPPPPGVSHLPDPPGDYNQHLAPRAPLTQPTNHLVYTTPTDPSFQS